MTPTVVLCPNGEGIDSEVRTIRQLTPDSPILVFESTADPELAEEAFAAFYRRHARPLAGFFMRRWALSCPVLRSM